MKKNQEKLKKGQVKRLRKLFLRAAAITLVVSSGLIAGGVALYNNYLYDGSGGSRLSKILKEETLAKLDKTLAVFGVDDEGYRPDIIFLVNFKSETGKVKVVSIPRDTKVDWSEEQQDRLALYSDYRIETSKLNEMTSYAGIENIRDFTIDEIENILGVPVDNYVIITTDVFKQLVDDIGGVEVEVPALPNGEGLHYDDNWQDLHIHLEPGLQTLNGEQAEGLVRFRKSNNGVSYAEGDVGRIKVQQAFLKAFAEKLLSARTITKVPDIIDTIFTSIKTDISLGEINTYCKYLKKIDTSQISFETIPGESEYIYPKWYYVVNEEEVPEFVDRVFYGIGEEVVEEEEIVEDKTVTIQVLNSTSITGAASKVKTDLETLGYTVSNIGNYGETVENTIIYTKDIAKANQFKAHFTDARIIQTNNIGYDIQIVLGNDIQ